ncbi:MAG TPA: 2-amino-4-hydroxy-6-hydroxymethyldihydropteridine diphosphokinase [Burkholderiales bacterium]|nr:2-amino-4-hydroxy-6-hydroxymethyldihydropteridine diphosphokinase [Burkholderiales bacterium]
MKAEGPDRRSAAPVTAFVALGANLGDPPAQIRSALRALAGLPATRLVRRSSLYRNPPAGLREQPDFVNAVAMVETALAPRALLGELLAIERAHGRVRDFPNAPRTLDLDLVLYGDLELREPGLTIPHPRMLERAFVLVPLAEIAPEAVVPGAGRVADLVGRVDASAMLKLEERGAADERG